MLTRRTFLSLPAAIAAAAEPAEKPNIAVVLCDDLGYGDTHCYNSESRIRTPHIDRLASEGVRFTDAHSPSAVCTPTRYGLMTGRYAWRTRLTHGVLNGTSPALIEDGRETLASLLKRSGYRTGCFGKWHLGLGTREPADYSQELRPSPLDYGFDEFFGIPASLDMPPYLYIDGRRAVEQPTSTIGDSHTRPQRSRGQLQHASCTAPTGGPSDPRSHCQPLRTGTLQHPRRLLEARARPGLRRIHQT
jgi:arylsulfatase A